MGIKIILYGNTGTKLREWKDVVSYQNEVENLLFIETQEDKFTVIGGIIVIEENK